MNVVIKLFIERLDVFNLAEEKMKPLLELHLTNLQKCCDDIDPHAGNCKNDLDCLIELERCINIIQSNTFYCGHVGNEGLFKEKFDGLLGEIYKKVQKFEENNKTSLQIDPKLQVRFALLAAKLQVWKQNISKCS